MFNNFAFPSPNLSANNKALGFMLPHGMSEAGLLSNTSDAYDCFVKQLYSKKLQAYMVNYVISVTSNYPVYL